MKSAIGNAMLTNIIIVFLVAVLGLLVTSISYTKAYRVKNRIVDAIESYNGDFTNHKNNIMSEVTNSLNSIGYRRKNGKSCSKIDSGTKEADYAGNDYYYCIYEYNTERGKYYKVISYMYLDLPVVGEYINIPVSGETKVFYN